MTAVVTDRPVRTIDTDGMSALQLAGLACASCRKRWPLPVVEIGVWLGGGKALVCPDCASGVT